MPREVLERVVSTYLALPFDSFSIVFQGGEPLLAGLDFFRAAAAAVRRFRRPGTEVCLAVQTNGTLLDRQSARFFADEGWLAGVSVDGPERFHDAWRRDAAGGGSYGAAMRGIGFLREAGAQFNVLCLATPANIAFPRETYRHLRDAAGAAWQQYSYWRERVSVREWDGFLCGVLDAWIEDGDAGRVKVGNIENAVAYVRHGIATQCIFADACDGCLVVERNGDVYPCDFHVSRSTLLGNIMTADWQTLRSSPRARAFAAAKCPRHLSLIPRMRFYDRIAESL